MPGIILNESEDEEGEVSGDVNTLQARDMFFFSERKLGQQEKIAGHTKTGRKRSQTRRQEI